MRLEILWLEWHIKWSLEVRERDVRQEEFVHEHGLFFKGFDSHLEGECQLASLSNPMIYPLAMFERKRLNPTEPSICDQAETPLAIFRRKKLNPPNH